MPTRLTTALLALLTFAAALVVVPLATAEPADAHTRTKTVQRCSYDPFAGNQCWTETVNVSHSHDPPTEEDLWDKPRDTRTSEQAAEDERKREQAEAERKREQAAEDERKREQAEAERKREEAERKRKAAEAERKRAECPAGTTGTPPNNCYPPPPDNDGDDDDEREKEAERKREEAKKKKDAESTDTPPPPTTTTTADPCGDYAENLIDALNRVNDGTNTPPTLPTRPAACKGMTTAEIQTWVDKVAALYGTTVANAWRKVFEYQGEAAINEAELHRQLGLEILKLWDATPDEAKRIIRATASGAACVALTKAIATTTVGTGGAAAPAWIAWLAAHPGTVGITCPALVEAAVIIVEIFSGDDSDPDGDDSTDDAADDSTDDAPDDSTDDSDSGDSDPPDGENAEENSAGSYCGPWTAFAWRALVAAGSLCS
ncbi:hypothetical protein [Candidatus Poriferisodalis sp.]|uniref:hypothetical protein n=1 Tax=Candidatus Poriferisodalis sp. TaxID=3101277 RepID=UPI003B01E281